MQVPAQGSLRVTPQTQPELPEQGDFLHNSHCHLWSLSPVPHGKPTNTFRRWTSKLSFTVLCLLSLPLSKRQKICVRGRSALGRETSAKERQTFFPFKNTSSLLSAYHVDFLSWAGWVRENYSYFTPKVSASVPDPWKDLYAWRLTWLCRSGQAG